GLFALRDAVSRTRAEPLAFAALVTWWIGAGLTLPYYGAEDFGLNAIARKVAGQPVDLLDLVKAVRFSPVAATVFGLGLAGLGVAAGPVLRPFGPPSEQIDPERHGNLCRYLPAHRQPGPAVVFVHGGPLPPDQRPTPRDWPVYRAYGSLAASRGAVGVTVD